MLKIMYHKNNMKIQNKKNKKNKLLSTAFFLIVIVVVVIIATIAFLYNNNKSDDNKIKTKKQEITRNDTTRNEGGVSVKRNADDIKRSEKISKNPDLKLQQSGSDKPKVDDKTTTAIVVLTSVGVVDDNVDASGFVSNIFQNEGVCRYIFTNGSKVITKESKPILNVSSTTCTTVNFPKNELDSGTWTVSLEYRKDNIYGKSNNDMEIDI